MAFWDFMSEPVGGAEMAATVNSQPSLYDWQGGDYGSTTAPGASQTAAQSPIKQMTWGELLKSLMSVSGSYPSYNSSFSSGPQMLGQGQGGIYPIGPTADFSQPKEKENTSAGEVMNIMSMFGV